jgi:hypothetical protein
MTRYAIFFALATISCGQDLPILEDERLNAIFQQASEYDLPRLAYRNGRYVSPSGIADAFPWRNPGGLGSAEFSRKFRFTTGHANDVRQYHGGTRARRTLHVRPVWTWHKSTVVAEVHYHPVSGHPYEVRLHEKTGDDHGYDEYESYIFRPANSEDDIPNCPQGRVQRVSQQANGFRFEGTRTVYPDHDIDWNQFVTRPWLDCTGHEWHHAGQGDGWLTPHGYDGWVVGSDRETCRRCHTHAGAPFQRFSTAALDAAFLVGGDGLFSLRPLDPKVSYNGRFSKWISLEKQK